MQFSKVAGFVLSTFLAGIVPGVESYFFPASFVALLKLDTVTDVPTVVAAEVARQKQLQTRCTAYRQLSARCPVQSVALVSGSPEYNVLGRCYFAGCFRANQTGTPVTLEAVIENQITKLPIADRPKGFARHLKMETANVKKGATELLEKMDAAREAEDFTTLGLYLTEADYKGYTGQVFTSAKVDVAKYHARQLLIFESWRATEFGASDGLARVLDDSRIVALVDDLQLVADTWKTVADTQAKETRTTVNKMEQLQVEMGNVKSELAVATADKATTSAELEVTKVTVEAVEQQLGVKTREAYRAQSDALVANAALKDTLDELSSSSSKLETTTEQLTALENTVDGLHEELETTKDALKTESSLKDTCLETLSMEQSGLLRSPDGSPNAKFYQALTQFYVTLPREVIESLDTLTQASGGSLPSWTAVVGVVAKDGFGNLWGSLFMVSLVTWSGFALVLGAVFLVVWVTAVIFRLVGRMIEYSERQFCRAMHGLGRLLKKMGVLLLGKMVAGFRFLVRRVR